MSLPILSRRSLDPVQLDDACRHWGFFGLCDHGVPSELLTEVQAQLDRFFSQSSTEKNLIRRTAQNSWGFNDAELTKNRKDWKEILDIGAPASSGPLAGSFPQWPQIEGFQPTFEALQNHLHEIAIELTAAIYAQIAGSNDIDPGQVVLDAFADHSSFIRLNYYPTCPDPAPADVAHTSNSSASVQGQLGISHHTDAGAITVLWQDQQPGLQVFQAEQWRTIDPVDGVLIINIGDIVQVWSNDDYRAPLHRVLANATHARYSIPYFLNPGYGYNYAPLTTTYARYEPINWGEFRAGRSAGDYADQGSEIQIADFAGKA